MIFIHYKLIHTLYISWSLQWNIQTPSWKLIEKFEGLDISTDNKSSPASNRFPKFIYSHLFKHLYTIMTWGRLKTVNVEMVTAVQLYPLWHPRLVHQMSKCIHKTVCFSWEKNVNLWIFCKWPNKYHKITLW